ncbi:Bug family tripartite tricarboxylate transporter substrate binding protein [Piscinibacter koreensis]|uniref:Twin-arginine translocation pathway signal protein n=1 Tax=Piscinibacter koreensis TaxID=2742824 RepID=A0A7Y6TYE5_9BURK|nr:Bug family tripartite tricarboxylate transporter substrate binding protein [Schlegelella koreensis]NUZ08012.1 twin-arginine translocation pathway signal protein [Schlegelella koreensis]
MSNRRQFVQRSAAALALPALFAGRAAEAQSVDVLKIVTGFAAGGTSDTVCRRLADALRGTYAKTALVENKTGAGGQIAIQSMKTVPADGTTLLQTPASMLTTYPFIYNKLQYDPVKDLTPVSLACVFEFGLAVGPLVPTTVTTVPEFLAWAKAHPEHASFGSPAAGSTPHFTGEMLSRAGGANLRHVPYRGTQPAMLELSGGQIAAVSGPIGDLLPHTGSNGKARLLGVSGAKRSRFAPQVPTYDEQGLKDIVTDEWFALYLPGGATPEVVQRMNAAVRVALAKREVVDGLAVMGLEARSSSAAELAALQQRDTARWGPIVKAVGFKAE